MNQRQADGPSADQLVIVFDGVCSVCNYWVDFLLRHDDEERFVFTANQQRAGAEIMARHGGPSGTRPDSIVVVDGDDIVDRSTAILRVCRELGFPYRIAAVLVVVPRPLRDWVYDQFAKRRYRFFGTRDTCRLPTAEERSRFLP